MARRKLETFEDYNRALKNRYGIGEGEDYKPWHRVQDVPSDGVRSQVPGIKSSRTHHCLSGIETELFYLVEFSDSVIDIREQFPLLPINLSLRIAKSLDIKHPFHTISREPIVITTDFLLTRRIGDEIVYEALTVKPENKSDELRVREKIEIERIWWELLGVKFNYYTGNKLTQIQSQNIKWATHVIRPGKQRFTEETIRSSLQYINTGIMLVKEICESFAKNTDVKKEHALELLRCLIGLKYIKVDLSRPLKTADFINVLSIANSN